MYSPAVTDFIFMVKNTSFMFLTVADLVESKLGMSIVSLGSGCRQEGDTRRCHSRATWRSQNACLQIRFLEY